MLFAVLVLTFINSIVLFSLWRNTRTSEVEVRFLPFEDDHPFLQLLIEEEDEKESEEVNTFSEVPEPVSSIDYGAWRNQKNIQPWAPNSSAPAQPAIPERKPLERPPGFV